MEGVRCLCWSGVLETYFEDFEVCAAEVFVEDASYSRHDGV